MARNQGVRASLGKTFIHGLLGWGALVGMVWGSLLIRPHEAPALPPLPLLTAHLPPSELHVWKSFPEYRRAVPVLVYHGIGGKASSITTSRQLFAEQMLALKVAGFHALTMQQYARFAHGDYKGLPSRPILITFDDGRLDAYRAADAILKADGLHAVEFVVPGWVTSHPKFSLNWAEITQMSHSGIWDIEEHFGYGRESVPIDRGNARGAAFAYREARGLYGTPESFQQFKQRVINNMFWGEKQLGRKVKDFQPLAMAIPMSDYGQSGTNDIQIPRFVISWLDSHYSVVFGGDYLNGAKNFSVQIPGRFSRKISYRMTMGPNIILPVLRCRLRDWATRQSIWKEYACMKLAKAPWITSPSP